MIDFRKIIGKVFDFFQKVAEGAIPGYSSGRKFGYYASISTTEQLVADIGGSPFFPATASTVEAISSSANDIAAGTGAQQITIIGLDSSWNELTATIEMNGTSATSATASTFFRVNRCFVSRVGTYHGANLGQITVRVSGAGSSWLIVPTGQGQTKHCVFTVPLGKTLYLYDVHLHPESSKSVAFNLWSYRNAQDVSAPYASATRTANKYPFTTTPVDYDYRHAPLVFTETTDIWMTAQTSTGTGSGTAEFTYALKDN